MADYRNAVDQKNNTDFSFGNTIDQANKLRQFLEQKNQFDQAQQQELLKQKLGHENDLDKQNNEHILNDQGAEKRFQQAQDYSRLHPQQGVSLGTDSASITPKPDMSLIMKDRMDLQKEKQKEAQVNKYTHAIQPTSDFTAAMQDLENITNKDGNGGIFTNPKAKLVSAGKISSSVPDSLMGLTTMLGVTDKGAAEERKAVARLRQSLGVAMGGARGMSPGVQAGLRDSMGAMASEDPQLMAKGIRGSARIMKGSLQNMQAGFSPDIRDTAHANAGMEDPIAFYNKVVPDSNIVPQQALPKSQMSSPSMMPASVPQSSGDPIQDELRKRGLIK